jgi:hypothetical protein
MYDRTSGDASVTTTHKLPALPYYLWQEIKNYNGIVAVSSVMFILRFI